MSIKKKSLKKIAEKKNFQEKISQNKVFLNKNVPQFFFVSEGCSAPQELGKCL